MTDVAVLSFIGFTHTYLLNTSITVRIYLNPLLKEEKACMTLRKRLRIRSVISVNYHYITVLCPFNLLIRFKCYNTV